MKKLAKDKHSSLLRRFVNYGRKNIGLWANFILKNYDRNLRILVISWSNVRQEPGACPRVQHFKSALLGNILPYPQTLD
jgi:hypothetical protein